MADTFDYIVIGAGSAGCVLANRLSADPSTRICVLEAGPSDWNPLIHMPVGYMKLMKDPTYNWLYETEASDWTGGRNLAHLDIRKLAFIGYCRNKSEYCINFCNGSGSDLCSAPPVSSDSS